MLMQAKLFFSPYLALYKLIIPKDDELINIKELVDFSFVYDEIKNNYCQDNGRAAIDPIRMFKYLFLKSLYDLSDSDLVDRSHTDMAFKYFLDMDPEEEVIDPSSLTKFCRQRLKSMDILDLLIQKTTQIVLEKDILKSKTLIVDSTHTKARYNLLSHHDALFEKANRLRKVFDIYTITPVAYWMHQGYPVAMTVRSWQTAYSPSRCRCISQNPR
jgi:transposase